MPKPTLYEKQLMESLGFERLEDLQKFLNLPTLPSLRMRVPELDESTAEDQWQEYMYQQA
jgi:hypothetical protein